MVQPDQKESYNVNTLSPFVPCCHSPEYRYVLVKRNGTLHPRERRQNPLDKQTQFKTCLACPNVHYNCIQVTFQPGCILWCRRIYLPEQYPFLFQYMLVVFEMDIAIQNGPARCWPINLFDLWRIFYLDIGQITPWFIDIKREHPTDRICNIMCLFFQMRREK